MNTVMPEEITAVAVSGGADSLFCLMRLQESGHRVIALHGVFFPPERDGAWAVRERLAEFCARRGIELYVSDFSEAFSRLVIRPFVQDYARGRTPNPCALCNARVKFGLLLDKAAELGAHRLATGHYARLEAASRGGAPALLRAKDTNKDQSYFLALVPGQALRRAVFPLGEIEKRTILAELERRNIVPPQPGESQEVCFVPDDRYREYVPRMARAFGIALPGPGPMLLRDGRRVGTHKGLWQYTEGQRKGLGIGWKEPLHVLGKEQEENILRLGSREEMEGRGCLCASLNMLLPPECWPKTVLVKTRYREKPKPATAEFTPDRNGQDATLRIRFLNPETPAAPGQIAAVYIAREKARQPGGLPEEDGAAPLRLVAGGIIIQSE